MNKVVLMGRLVADPVQRFANNNQNTMIVTFRLAVNRRFNNNNEQQADFFNCTAFNKTAEFISKYFKKGQQILIEGRIENNNYTDSSGTKKYETRIVIEQVDFCGSKNQDQFTPAQFEEENKNLTEILNNPFINETDELIANDELPF